MYKITLEDFWKSKNKIGIHCNTVEKANILLKAFDRMGKTWGDGESYLAENYHSFYGMYTTYINDGYFASVKFAEKFFTVYKFEEVDLGKEMELETSENTDKCLKIISERLKNIVDKLKNTDTKSIIRSVTLNEKKKITTVVFTDGDKKMVKCGEHDIYSSEMGITYCIALKAMDMSKTQYKKMIDKFVNKE